MADSIAFELVSPERLLMEADVHGVMVPGREGDFTVLPGHAPVISTLRPAVVDVFETEGADPVRIFVRGGFVDCSPSAFRTPLRTSKTPSPTTSGSTPRTSTTN